MDWTKVKEEPADETTRTLADCAHDYCRVLRRFEDTAKKCPFHTEDLCTKLAGSWRCGIINCPYATPIFMMYIEETKRSD
jgi:hypothetical protein